VAAQSKKLASARKIGGPKYGRHATLRDNAAVRGGGLGARAAVLFHGPTVGQSGLYPPLPPFARELEQLLKRVAQRRRPQIRLDG
jgi:hypothetical protein